MRKVTCILFLVITSLGFSQNNPINFETGGFGASWTWTVFENDTNPPLEIVSNPMPTGVNTSATVAKFTALATGAPFAGVESMHGSDIGTFTLNASNAIVKIMVWKSKISDVGIKFATAAGASTGEIKVPNTVIEQWEELTFDFTGIIGEPSSTDIDQIIVFPDFETRTSDSIIYFDSITLSDGILDVSTFDQKSVEYYPNPISTVWNINSKDIITQIIFYNQLGQNIKTVTPNSMDYSLNINEWNTGIYFANVVTQKGDLTIKLIKI